MKTTLFVPTLNEIEGITKIMPRIKDEWFDQILIVDGNSTDGTAEKAREMGFEVYVQKKPGMRHAFIEAWPLVRGDVVVAFSPDGNCLPEDIPALLAKFREGYDMVIGSRYFNGARSEDDDLITRFGNWFFTNLINFLHGGSYTDAMVIYRAYRKSLIYELDLHRDESFVTEKIFCTVMGFEPLLSVRAAKRKLKVAEVLAFEPKRTYGKRKLQIFRWGGACLLQVLRELYYWK